MDEALVTRGKVIIKGCVNWYENLLKDNTYVSFRADNIHKCLAIGIGWEYEDLKQVCQSVISSLSYNNRYLGKRLSGEDAYAVLTAVRSIVLTIPYNVSLVKDLYITFANGISRMLIGADDRLLNVKIIPMVLSTCGENVFVDNRAYAGVWEEIGLLGGVKVPSYAGNGLLSIEDTKRIEDKIVKKLARLLWGAVKYADDKRVGYNTTYCLRGDVDTGVFKLGVNDCENLAVLSGGKVISCEVENLVKISYEPTLEEAFKTAILGLEYLEIPVSNLYFRPGSHVRMAYAWDSTYEKGCKNILVM